jgi:hypothetical protein
VTAQIGREAAAVWRHRHERSYAFDDEASEQTKARYKFPYGDFAKVHPCDLLAAEVRSGRPKYRSIEDAAIRLRDMIDEAAH